MEYTRLFGGVPIGNKKHKLEVIASKIDTFKGSIDESRAKPNTIGKIRLIQTAFDTNSVKINVNKTAIQVKICGLSTTDEKRETPIKLANCVF